MLINFILAVEHKQSERILARRTRVNLSGSQTKKSFIFNSGGCTDTTDANCMEGGSVTSPGSTQCETTPCFCRLGYNPVYDAANNKITCSATECNPLVDVISAQCKCQYTTGAVSFDMTSCKCAGQYAPSQPNDGTCTNECASEQANCKVSDNSVEECGGGGCVCRAGYTSVYNTASQVYQCEPYECDSSVAGCVCSNPGDVSSCTCTGTTTVGSATITYVGNKYAFPGYCRPVECNPSSDSNCACVDSSLLDTCYCKPGYAIDYQYDQILIDATTNSLDVSTYFSTSCKRKLQISLTILCIDIWSPSQFCATHNNLYSTGYLNTRRV